MKIVEVLNGKNNKYYHGSNTKIDIFDVNKLETGGNDENGPGIYFVNDREFAKRFGKYIYTVQFDKMNLIQPNQVVIIDELIKFINLSPRNKIEAFVENYGEDPSNLGSSVNKVMKENFFGTNRQDAFLELWGHSLLQFDTPLYFRIMQRLGYDGMLHKRNEYTILTIYNDSKIRRV